MKSRISCRSGRLDSVVPLGGPPPLPTSTIDAHEQQFKRLGSEPNECSVEGGIGSDEEVLGGAEEGEGEGQVIAD